MSGDKKSSVVSEPPGRLGVKRGGKLLSKTSKPSGSTISSPPKAALASSSWNKDEAHRRRNHLNEILRRRSGDTAESSRNKSPARQDVEHEHIANADNNAHPEYEVEELEIALKIAEERQKELQEKLKEIKSQHKVNGEPAPDIHEALREDSDPKVGLDVATSTSPANTSFHETDIIQHNHDLRFKITQLQDQLLSQEVRHREAVEQARSQDSSDALRARLHAIEKQSQERLQQLLSLKSSISTMTRSDAQTTDCELVESFSQLANRIREWVISNYRRSKLQFSDLPPQTIKSLRLITPSWPAIGNQDRLTLYQAIVSKTLMPILEEPLSVGLPETGSLSLLKQFVQQSQRATTPAFREWRRATIRILESEEYRDTLSQNQSALLTRIAQEIEHVLFTLTSVNLNAGAQATLLSILRVAADLQRTLALQKAQYQTVFPYDQAGTGVQFNAETMESINDEAISDDGEDSSARVFLFCVFPSLQKYGDEMGETEVCNILMKARVCCGVD